MTTAFYTHPDCHGHDMGAGHPECPARLDAIDDLLIASGLQSALDCREAPIVDSADLGNAHSSGYVVELRDVLERVAADGRLRALDPDTVASPGTLNAVLRAAGLTNASDGRRIGLEGLLRHPPDLLVVATAPGYPSLASELLDHPALADLARRAIPPALTICAGPFTARAAALLAR